MCVFFVTGFSKFSVYERGVLMRYEVRLELVFFVDIVVLIIAMIFSRYCIFIVRLIFDILYF